jgi:hypothetical protein
MFQCTQCHILFTQITSTLNFHFKIFAAVGKSALIKLIKEKRNIRGQNAFVTLLNDFFQHVRDEMEVQQRL